MPAQHPAAPYRPLNHNLVYTALLGLTAVFVTIATLGLNHIRRRPETSPEMSAHLLLQIRVEIIFITLIVLGLLTRLLLPRHRKWPTRILNVILLFLFPFGTFLAIYGFWNVDKSPKTTTQSAL